MSSGANASGCKFQSRLVRKRNKAQAQNPNAVPHRIRLTKLTSAARRLIPIVIQRVVVVPILSDKIPKIHGAKALAKFIIVTLTPWLKPFLSAGLNPDRLARENMQQKVDEQRGKPMYSVVQGSMTTYDRAWVPYSTD